MYPASIQLSVYCWRIFRVVVLQGEIMNRLQIAMKYNVKENKTLLAQGRRKAPVVQIRRGKVCNLVSYQLPRLADFSS